MSKPSKPSPPNGPSTTVNKSGKGRGNTPPNETGSKTQQIITKAASAAFLLEEIPCDGKGSAAGSE